MKTRRKDERWITKQVKYLNSKVAYCYAIILVAILGALIVTNPARAEKMGAFVFTDSKECICIYIDENASDFDGMQLVAEAFSKDVEKITGKKPEIITDASKLSGNVVILGSIGNNQLIDNLILDGKLDVSEIKDKWECYTIRAVSSPLEGIHEAIVVAGSDKRGAFYGIFHISELLGVSPWYYFADVEPMTKNELSLKIDELEVTSKEPSVKYRGIFLNDEAPSLTSWVNSNFGTYNEGFYEHVFELILRLKGNYMWPAMWSNSFSSDGSSSLIANAELANRYGIVMGTSHHEPMCRAGVEWKRNYTKYGTSDAWDFATNEKEITAFWEDGIRRNGEFENVITLGMRGEADSALAGSLEYNVNLLKSVITTQKNILKQFNLKDAPKVLTVYKEVEKYWYGTDKVEGLRYWDELDDVTIMLCEDNFGNLRTLPSKEERERDAGWGMYYHVDYHGGPKSYEWICTTPVEKIAEQMSMAYEYGIQDIWILNVGDLKPMEVDISYFLDLAYDFDTYNINGIKGVTNYIQDWVNKQFGTYCDGETISMIADVIDTYLHMNGNRKPETINTSTYSLVNHNEAQLMLQLCEELIRKCDAILTSIPQNCKDTFYQLAYYPAVASANVNEMWIFAGLNQFYSSGESSLANLYALLTNMCITKDKELQTYYNKKMSDGKWDGMMSSNHVGYVTWNDEGWSYPTVSTVSLVEGSRMLVDVEGDVSIASVGELSLQPFHNLQQETYAMTISNGGQSAFEYNIATDCDWLIFSNTEGTVETGNNVYISVDWNKVLTTTEGSFTIKGANSEVVVSVTALVTDVSGITKGTFVGTDGIISVYCSDMEQNVRNASNVTWSKISNYGKSINDMSSMKVFPSTITFDDPMKAPSLLYRIYVNEDGVYTFTLYSAPTNNLTSDVALRYAVGIDREEPVILSAIPRNFEAGGNSNRPWCEAVTNNILLSETKLELTKGEHLIQIYAVDAGIVLQKFVVAKEKLLNSFFGPDQSYRVGDTLSKKEGYRYDTSEIVMHYLPGAIELEECEYNTAYSMPIQLTKQVNGIIRLYGVTNHTSPTVVVKIDGEVCGMQLWKEGTNFVEISSMILKKLEIGAHVMDIIINNGELRLFATTIRDKSEAVEDEKNGYVKLISETLEKESELFEIEDTTLQATKKLEDVNPVITTQENADKEASHIVIYLMIGIAFVILITGGVLVIHNKKKHK